MHRIIEKTHSFVNMDIETARNYCLGSPCTNEDSAFGEDYVLFRVCDKIFACVALTNNNHIVLKCDPEYARELRESYAEVTPAWHWNKKHWNQVSFRGLLTDDLILSLIRHSYNEVAKKLPKRILASNPEIAVVE